MDSFDDDAVASIVRRAVELDAGRGEMSSIDHDALVAAATEVGIDRSAIELAIAEHQVRPVARRRRLDRVFGPRQAVVARRIDLAPGLVYTAVGEWLTRAQFRPLRRDRHVTVWDRRTDLAASARRLVAALVGGVRLGETSRLEVQVVPVGTDSALVQISGEHPSRRVAAAATSASLATVGAASLVAAIWVPPVALLALPTVAGAAGIAFAARHQARRTSVDIDRLLDQLAADERPNLLGVPRRTPGWRGRIPHARSQGQPTS